MRGHFHPAVLQVAGDLVFLDPALDDVVAAIAQLGEQPRASLSELALEGGRPAHARNQLAAVASRCSPSDAIGLEQDHGIAALGERESGREARESASDDADIGLVPALE